MTNAAFTNLNVYRDDLARFKIIAAIEKIPMTYFFAELIDDYLKHHPELKELNIENTRKNV